MAVTININGLTLCHKGSGGKIQNTLPDVCKTPPNAIPKPFNITSLSKDLSNGTSSIKADGGNMAANLGSKFTTCSGNEGGSLGGVVSGTFLGESTWISYSSNVYLEGKPACRLSDKMLMNKGNCAGMAGLQQQSLAEQIKVLCEIFCEIRKKGQEAKRKNPNKRFNYSKEASDLSKSSRYESKIGRAFGKGFASEKTFTTLVRKGAMSGTGRKLMSKAALVNRLTKELGEQAAKKLAKKAAGKIILKFVPFVNVVSTAYDIYDIGKTALDISRQVDDMLKNYDAFRMRPDVAQLGPDGEIKEIFDYKFDYPAGGSDSMAPDQEALYRSKSGKAPITIDQEQCKCQ